MKNQFDFAAAADERASQAIGRYVTGRHVEQAVRSGLAAGQAYVEIPVYASSDGMQKTRPFQDLRQRLLQADGGAIKDVSFTKGTEGANSRPPAVVIWLKKPGIFQRLLPARSGPHIS